MIRFKKLLGKIFLTMKSLSPKAYTKGLVIVSAGMVTVLLLGTNGFIVNSKTNPEKVIDQDEKVVEEVDATKLEQTAQETELPQSSNLMKEEEDVKAVFEAASQETLNEKEIVIYTEEDFMALVKIVEAEATGEDVKGKIMVANVVLNRVKSDRFPNTIYDVVYQEYNGRAQFSPIDDGRIDSVTLTDATYEAVERALQGEDYSEGAMFFAARSMASSGAMSWFDNSLTKVAQYGVHEFYTY
jgi:N-acetylmuramoyl-L-alanine amidase